MSEQEEDIRESLRILFTTEPGERVMQPMYGCALRRHMFNPLHPQTVAEIREEIRRAILFFEPRIALEQIRVDELDQAEGRLLLNLDYTVRTTNTRHNLVFPLYLHQGTDIAVGG